jgi:hypothetical protein
LPALRRFKLARKKKTQQKPPKVKIEKDVVHVELSPQLQERLGEAARMSGKSETDLIREAIAEAISRRTNQKPNSRT